MHNIQAGLSDNNRGVIEIEQYANSALPEDYEITDVLDDIIMAEYADTTEDGKGVIRNGIILPESIVDQKAWRVGRVVLAGPNVKHEKLKAIGTFFIFPGDRGLRSIKRNGRHVVFINEQRVFCVCAAPEIKPVEKCKKKK